MLKKNVLFITKHEKATRNVNFKKLSLKNNKKYIVIQIYMLLLSLLKINTSTVNFGTKYHIKHIGVYLAIDTLYKV